jgi:poly-gamma-glutamate synthesis protein (capsule biosynthesis protein)
MESLNILLRFNQVDDFLVMFKSKSFFLIISCFVSGLLIIFLVGFIWGSKINNSSPPVSYPTQNKSEVTEQQTTLIKFTSQISPIPPQMKEKMIGVTWKFQCPITLDELVLLKVSYWNSEGNIAQGSLIVAQDVAEPIRHVFEELFRLKFPIHSMRPAYEFDGDDQRSMAANNTSAFNCRPVEGTNKWSQHAYGKAIDINPLVNPYIKQGLVLPPEGKSYVKRDINVPGLIHADSPVVSAFATIGWKWGGDWQSLKDYQHFSHNGL